MLPAPAIMQQTRRTPLLLSVDGTDRQTDGHQTMLRNASTSVIFLPVIQSQAVWEHDSLSNTHFQVINHGVVVRVQKRRAGSIRRRGRRADAAVAADSKQLALVVGLVRRIRGIHALLHIHTM